MRAPADLPTLAGEKNLSTFSTTGSLGRKMFLGRCNDGLDQLERRRVDLGLTVVADYLAQPVFKIEKPASRLGLHGPERYNET